MSIVSDVLAALDRIQWWRELRTVPDRMTALEQRLAALESPAARPAGPRCPLCEVGSLKVVKVEPHPVMGDLGLQQHTLRCTDATCAHTETRQVDPAERR